MEAVAGCRLLVAGEGLVALFSSNQQLPTSNLPLSIDSIGS
jgi:hypothetical protein